MSHNFLSIKLFQKPVLNNTCKYRIISQPAALAHFEKICQDLKSFIYLELNKSRHQRCRILFLPWYCQTKGLLQEFRNCLFQIRFTSSIWPIHLQNNPWPSTWTALVIFHRLRSWLYSFAKKALTFTCA